MRRKLCLKNRKNGSKEGVLGETGVRKRERRRELLMKVVEVVEEGEKEGTGEVGEREGREDFLFDDF